MADAKVSAQTRAVKSPTTDHHPNWKGDKAHPRTGRSRALNLYPKVGPCKLCGAKKAERHHVDGNTLNNSPDNIAVLCRRCHMKLDGRLDQFIAMARENRKRRWLRKVNTTARSGDPCPKCGKPMRVTRTRPTLVYIGCVKRRGGCGYSAGSYRRARPAK